MKEAKFFFLFPFCTVLYLNVFIVKIGKFLCSKDLDTSSKAFQLCELRQII